jgi:hypothetical protein
VCVCRKAVNYIVNLSQSSPGGGGQQGVVCRGGRLGGRGGGECV